MIRRKISFFSFAVLLLVFSLATFLPRIVHAQSTATKSTVLTLIVIGTSTPPTVSTSPASSVGSTTATLNGVIISTGGITVSETGFAYGLDPTLTTGVSTSTLGSSASPFSQDLTGLIASTTYYFRAYAINLAGTGFGGIQSFFTASSTATSSPATSTPPVTSPPTTSTSSGGQGYIILFKNLVISESTTTALVQWSTNIPTVSILSLGLNTDGGLGSVAEINANLDHTIALQGLIPNTTYFVTIYATAPSGMKATIGASFRTEPLGGPILPSNVTDFAASESSGGNVLLTWVNPFNDPNFVSVRITRGTRFFPRDPQEGYVVYEGNGEAALDMSALPGVTYYYSIFAKDADGKYSSGVVLKYILEINTASTTSTIPIQPPPNPPLFGGAVTVAASTTLGQIIFIQDNKQIYSENGDVHIQDGSPVIVEIAPRLISRDTEETLIQVDGKNGLSSFIFKSLDNGWLETTIPSSFGYFNVSPFVISFLSIGSEIHIPGQFIVSISGNQISVPNCYENDDFILGFIVIPLVIIVFIYLLIRLLRCLLRPKQNPHI